MAYSYYPNGLTVEAVVGEILFSMGLSQSLALEVLGFNNHHLPDLLFSICVLLILVPDHPLSKII
jgi:hypothetical protein